MEEDRKTVLYTLVVVTFQALEVKSVGRTLTFARGLFHIFFFD
jgi:hypothetical protein